MKIRYQYLALAACLFIGSGMRAQAEEYHVGEGWKTQFADGKMTANFDADEVLQAVRDLQPGDQVTISLTLENQDRRSTDWYMTNEVLSSLEDSNHTASGGAYTYELFYTDSKGAVTTLYSSDSVGGEGLSEAGEGLREVSNAMEEYFYLDRLESGASGRIDLGIMLDGETQGNGYQNTLARLQMAFAADPVTGGGNGNGGGSGSGGGNGNGSSDGTPQSPASVAYTLGGVQTGDNSPLMLWSMLALAAGLGLMICGFIMVRRSERGEDA